jgi:tRNA isopentenyl-2-thiomethyl-A-37 hydroxylase MiaE
MDEQSVRLSNSKDRKSKLSAHTIKNSNENLSNQSSKSEHKKPTLIDLSIDMRSLNDMLKNIIETINQHAVLLNSISTTCMQKFDRISMKILYKNSFTKDLINKWQSLTSREELRHLDNPKVAKPETVQTDVSQKSVYTAPLGVEYKKKVADIRVNKEVVEAEKLLKEYLYQKEFPSFVIQSSLRLSDDVKYLHELTKRNKTEFQQMMESFKKETEEKSKIFDRQVEEKIEVLHQEILAMKHEQTKF